MDPRSVPPEAITAAARQLAHCISGTERQPWPEPDAEDIMWATRALEAAAPHLAAAAFPVCPTPCDPDCEQACHEVHDVASHRDHDPEQCRATQLAQAAAAERARLTQPLAKTAGILRSQVAAALESAWEGDGQDPVEAVMAVVRPVLETAAAAEREQCIQLADAVGAVYAPNPGNWLTFTSLLEYRHA